MPSVASAAAAPPIAAIRFFNAKLMPSRAALYLAAAPIPKLMILVGSDTAANVASAKGRTPGCPPASYQSGIVSYS